MIKGPSSHSYFSHRLKLHYLDWGDPNAFPVLLIHGSQDNCHTWDWTCEAMINNYRFLVPDLRGHGDSAWAIGSSYSSLDYVYDIHQLVEQSCLEKVHVVGHSLGGMVACLFSGLFPERVASLTSIEGVGAYWQEKLEKESPKLSIRERFSQAHAFAARVPRRYETMDDALKRMQASNPHLSPEKAKHLTNHGSYRNEDGTYTWKFDPYTYSWPPVGLQPGETIQIWEDISCPTLLLNATDGLDYRTGQNDTLKHFRTADLKIIPEAGHWLHHDQFDRFSNQLDSFLRRAISDSEKE